MASDRPFLFSGIHYLRTTAAPLVFPMQLFTIQTLQVMEFMETYQELLKAAKIREQHFDHLGRVIFISHQWLCSKEPDPNGHQLAAINGVLTRLEDGDIPTIESHWLQQVQFPASNVVITAKHFQDCLPALWCWLDRGCIPGITTRENNDGVKMASTLQILQSAVESIPASAVRGGK